MNQNASNSVSNISMETIRLNWEEFYKHFHDHMKLFINDYPNDLSADQIKSAFVMWLIGYAGANAVTAAAKKNIPYKPQRKEFLATLIKRQNELIEYTDKCTGGNLSYINKMTVKFSTTPKPVFYPTLTPFERDAIDKMKEELTKMFSKNKPTAK